MRRKADEVRIGTLVLSSERPVAVQSMLNTSTMDTDACISQAIRIIEAGGQLVRITAPGVKEAENLKNIRQGLRARGYDTPLSADIHFTPEAALVAARYVESVRINPGNFADRRAVFKKVEYTDEEYAVELESLERKFTGFLEVCRKYHTVVRIGTNHGSLSDRIMSRYGDTPVGMVEATMEYLRVCKTADFRDVVISLKSSDCRVMVDAVRLLVRAMEREGMHYPLHLGVTEAGEGEDGRIRSAVGIGTLLNEGIGDTIRVSLTEAPEAEIPVARALTGICSRPEYDGGAEVLKGDCSRPVMVADFPGRVQADGRLFRVWGVGEREGQAVGGNRFKSGVRTPEMIYVEMPGEELACLPDDVRVIVPRAHWEAARAHCPAAVPLYTVGEYVGEERVPEQGAVFVKVDSLGQWDETLTARLRTGEETVAVLAFGTDYHAYRKAFRLMQSEGLHNRTLLLAEVEGRDKAEVCLTAAACLGGLFLDRLPGGLWVRTRGIRDAGFALELGRNILQSAGVRRYKAEFISCPGCGRTLFDLQGAVAKVKATFGHLDRLKIAVMGCVVNGPGEMGDADFGYVGVGNGKVNLYKGRQVMRTAVPENEAIDVLRRLIETEEGNVDGC